MIDVGQGDSFLIRIKPDKNILIDTGGRFSWNNENWQARNRESSIAINRTIPMLKSFGIRHIDYLILTHGHDDHMGEAINFVSNFKVGKVIMNSDEINHLEAALIEVLDKKKIPYGFYKNGNLLEIKNVKLEFINHVVANNENESSLVFYLTMNNITTLFTGDIGIRTESALIRDNLLREVDILKIGHHGSRFSTSEEFLDVLKPRYALIGVGKNNTFGHPTQIVMDNLEARGIKTFLTSVHGSVKIIFDDHGIIIKNKPP